MKDHPNEQGLRRSIPTTASVTANYSISDLQIVSSKSDNENSLRACPVQDRKIISLRIFFISAVLVVVSGSCSCNEMDYQSWGRNNFCIDLGELDGWNG